MGGDLSPLPLRLPAFLIEERKLAFLEVPKGDTLGKLGGLRRRPAFAGHTGGVVPTVLLSGGGCLQEGLEVFADLEAFQPEITPLAAALVPFRRTTCGCRLDPSDTHRNVRCVVLWTLPGPQCEVHLSPRLIEAGLEVVTLHEVGVFTMGLCLLEKHVSSFGPDGPIFLGVQP